MAYKVKNISTKDFAFEGINLKPGEVSGELQLDTYQRLLALNYGTALMPVEEEIVAPLVEDPVIDEEPSPEPEPIQEIEAEEIAVPVEDLSSEAETVEVTVEDPAPAVAEVPVEAPKKRGRPRKNP